MSVTSLKTQTTELQEMYEAFKADYQKHLDITTEYENKFMNAFEDFCCFMTRGMRDLTGIIDKHMQTVSQIQQAHEENKFEEGNFNKVSLIKKQDTTIRQLEIKIAELESKLTNIHSTTKPVNTNPAPVVTTTVETTMNGTPAEIKNQCCARVGKAKYNISKQAAGFMDDFPAGTFITKTGCVVGLSCPNIITTAGVSFCPDHNNGKFEDIRLEPGTTSQPVATSTVPETAAESVADKKKSTAKRTSKKTVAKTTELESTVVISQEPEPVTVQEPALIIQEPEPVTVQEPEPVIVQELETVQELVVISQEPEPVVISQEPEPVVISQEPEPVQEPVVIIQQDPEPADMPVPSFDDIEFYDDPSGKTYYLDSKTKCIYEIAPNDEIGVFVKRLI